MSPAFSDVYCRGLEEYLRRRIFNVFIKLRRDLESSILHELNKTKMFLRAVVLSCAAALCVGASLNLNPYTMVKRGKTDCHDIGCDSLSIFAKIYLVFDYFNT